ncbi:TPA: hypothetical protein QCQ12_002093 [Bacillus cereus biovar anthracis]|nr:hypothetical protein BACI_c43220 [Bacillus cereus biovar anthracis str. CI]HDR4493323.1 hypothetical protein [Bacillus cereus biovar anthracis]HDR6232083.1 hypothetical protein [Bacillus cereus biovar anthracis]
MGIANVRKFLDSLNEEEKKEVVIQISKKYRYERSRKTKGQIETAMMNFIMGKNTTVEYLEVFLECIEKVFNVSVINILQGKFEMNQVDGKDLLMREISNTSFPLHIQSHLNDEYIRKEVQGLFWNIINLCGREESIGKKKFGENLHDVNRFLNLCLKNYN